MTSNISRRMLYMRVGRGMLLHSDLSVIQDHANADTKWFQDKHMIELLMLLREPILNRIRKYPFCQVGKSIVKEPRTATCVVTGETIKVSFWFTPRRFQDLCLLPRETSQSPGEDTNYSGGGFQAIKFFPENLSICVCEYMPQDNSTKQLIQTTQTVSDLQPSVSNYFTSGESRESKVMTFQTSTAKKKKEKLRRIVKKASNYGDIEGSGFVPDDSYNKKEKDKARGMDEVLSHLTKESQEEAGSRVPLLGSYSRKCGKETEYIVDSKCHDKSECCATSNNHDRLTSTCSIKETDSGGPSSCKTSCLRVKSRVEVSQHVDEAIYDLDRLNASDKAVSAEMNRETNIGKVKERAATKDCAVHRIKCDEINMNKIPHATAISIPQDHQNPPGDELQSKLCWKEVLNVHVCKQKVLKNLQNYAYNVDSGDGKSVAKIQSIYQNENFTDRRKGPDNCALMMNVDESEFDSSDKECGRYKNVVSRESGGIHDMSSKPGVCPSNSELELCRESTEKDIYNHREEVNCDMKVTDEKDEMNGSCEKSKESEKSNKYLNSKNQLKHVIPDDSLSDTSDADNGLPAFKLLKHVSPVLITGQSVVLADLQCEDHPAILGDDVDNTQLPDVQLFLKDGSDKTSEREGYTTENLIPSNSHPVDENMCVESVTALNGFRLPKNTFHFKKSKGGMKYSPATNLALACNLPSTDTESEPSELDDNDSELPQIDWGTRTSSYVQDVSKHPQNLSRTDSGKDERSSCNSHEVNDFSVANAEHISFTTLDPPSKTLRNANCKTGNDQLNLSLSVNLGRKLNVDVIKSPHKLTKKDLEDFPRSDVRSSSKSRCAISGSGDEFSMGCEKELPHFDLDIKCKRAVFDADSSSAGSIMGHLGPRESEESEDEIDDLPVVDLKNNFVEGDQEILSDDSEKSTISEQRISQKENICQKRQSSSQLFVQSRLVFKTNNSSTLGIEKAPDLKERLKRKRKTGPKLVKNPKLLKISASDFENSMMSTPDNALTRLLFNSSQKRKSGKRDEMVDLTGREEWIEKDLRYVKKIEHLKEEHLQYLTRKNEEYLQMIFEGKIHAQSELHENHKLNLSPTCNQTKCNRHDMFLKSAACRAQLTYMVQYGKFSEDNLEVIMDEVVKLFCKNSSKYLDYVAKVLLPELLIKICMDVLRVSYEEAQGMF